MVFNKLHIALVAVVVLSASLWGQNVNIESPQEIQVQRHLSPEEVRDRVNRSQFKHDAKELADVCASVPADMDALSQGVLSKDLLDKLKRVEKLSKHVRDELTKVVTAP